MEKIGLLVREKIVGEIKDRISQSQGYFFIDFNKVAAFSVNNLRNDLKSSGANIFVTKNSLFKKALKESGYEELSGLLEAETGIVFAQDKGIVEACKVLVDFSKENETLKIKGAIINDKKVETKDLIAMSKLPSREVLLQMAVSGIASPLTGFMNALNQIILKFVWVVQEIKNKKEK